MFEFLIDGQDDYFVGVGQFVGYQYMCQLCFDVGIFVFVIGKDFVDGIGYFYLKF